MVLVGWAAGQVVFKDDSYFLGHAFTFPPSIVPARTVAVSCDRAQRHGQAPAELRTRLDKYVPTASFTRAATLSYWC